MNSSAPLADRIEHSSDGGGGWAPANFNKICRLIRGLGNTHENAFVFLRRTDTSRFVQVIGSQTAGYVVEVREGPTPENRTYHRVSLPSDHRTGHHTITSAQGHRLCGTPAQILDAFEANAAAVEWLAGFEKTFDYEPRPGGVPCTCDTSPQSRA